MFVATLWHFAAGQELGGMRRARGVFCPVAYDG